MSEDSADKQKQFEFESCNVKCPKCNTDWVSSLVGPERFLCLVCGGEIEPKKHLVVKDETEVQ